MTRPRSVDMKPGDRVRDCSGGETYMLAARTERGWRAPDGYRLSDDYIDNRCEYLGPAEPDTPRPPELVEGEYLTTLGEVRRLGLEWKRRTDGAWFGGSGMNQLCDEHVVIARRPDPLVAVMLPEDVVREAVEDRWFKNYLATGGDPDLIDTAFRDAVAKLDEEATDG